MQGERVLHPRVDAAKRSVSGKMDTAMTILIGVLLSKRCSLLVDIGKLAAGL
jgi:hypothetical protein